MSSESQIPPYIGAAATAVGGIGLGCLQMGAATIPGILVGVGSLAFPAIINYFSGRDEEHRQSRKALASALHNEHLARAAAKAVKLTILKCREIDADKPPALNGKSLERLAEFGETYWLELYQSRDQRIEPYAEEKLSQRVTEYLCDDPEDPKMPLAVWRSLLLEMQVEAGGGFEFDELQINKIAGTLTREFPKQLYSEFKTDLAYDGEAFAGIVIQLLCHIMSDVNDLRQNPPPAVNLSPLFQRFEKLRDIVLLQTRDVFNQLDEQTRQLLTGLRAFREENRQAHATTHSELKNIRNLLSQSRAEVSPCEPESEDSIGFVRTFRPGKLPDAMSSPFPDDLVIRKKEATEMNERLSPNVVLPVEGVAHSGKTAFVVTSLSNDSVCRKLKTRTRSDVSVLYLDLNAVRGPRPILRRLAFALGELKRMPDADDPEAITPEETRAELLHEILFSRLRGRAPLVVLDDVDDVTLTDDNLADLRALLQFRPFSQGAILTLTDRAISQKVVEHTGREIKKPLEIGPLSPDEAEQLLTMRLEDRELTAATITQIKHTPELLLAGAFTEGITQFKNQVNAGSIEKEPTTLANTILECASADVLEPLKSAGCDFSKQSEGGILGERVSVIAMAVLAKLPVTERHLTSARLPIEFYNRLRDHGWLQSRGNGFCLPSMVCAALRLQMETMQKAPAGKWDCSELADAVDALIQAVESQSAHDGETILDEALEEALSWLERRLPGESLLTDRVRSAFLSRTAADMVAPISKSDSVAYLKRLGESDKPLSLTTAITNLILEIRVGNDAQQYLKSFRTAIDIAKRSSEITVSQLRGLDASAFSGVKRYQLFREVLELREALLGKLHDLTVPTSATPNFIRISISWALTTAELGFRLGKTSQLLLDKESSWLDKLRRSHDGEVTESDLSWLRARLSRMTALLAGDQDIRLKYLYDAIAEAERALFHGTRKITQTRFYLRMVRNLVQELSQESQRRQAVDAAVDIVGRTFGQERAGWPLEIYTQLAALLRYEAGLINSPALRLKQLSQTVLFLNPAEGRAVYLAQEGDSRPLLVLARVYREFARELVRQGKYQLAENPMHEAKRLGELAVKRFPTSASWSFLIGIGEMMQKATRSFGWNSELLWQPFSSMGDAMKELLKRCRQWLDQIDQPSFSEGKVALKCFQREWRVQGSLLHLCAEEAESKGKDWQKLGDDLKLKALLRHYHTRKRKLQYIDKRYGYFAELVLAQIHLEAQLQYASALAHKDGIVDTTKITALFQQVEQRFPNSVTLESERARFHRHIWNYGDAISGFTAIAERALDAAERRDAVVELIESLVTAAIYTDGVTLPDGTRLEKQALLIRAHDWLCRIFNYPDIAKEVAILKDQVELELGGEIDWAKNDEAYDSVIGGSEGYCSTVVDNLDSLRSNDSEVATYLWEAVIQNFTHPEVLRGLGQLYLRSAELGRRTQPLQDAERAYGCFNACRCLEVSASESGKESAVTCYERGRTILAGAVIAQSMNPFSANRGKQPTLLDLASSLFDSAKDRSVGSFRQTASIRNRELQALKRTLSGK